MRIGIVGHEAAKFTDQTRAAASEAITNIIVRERPITVVSGGCHLGGIDKWAVMQAEARGCQTLTYLPAHRRWEPDGYKARNICIAEKSDIIYNIVVRELPETYTGMRFRGCYH